MRRLLRWIWQKGMVSTFMAGFFVILPIAITIGIMGYMGSLLATWVGSNSTVGSLLQRIGSNYVTDATLSSLRGLLATFFDVGPDRPWKLAERVEVPVVTVYGQRDQLVDAKAAHRVTRHFPDAHVVVLPDSGHVAMMEHPAEVAGAWRRFIGRVSVPTA